VHSPIDAAPLVSSDSKVAQQELEMGNLEVHDWSGPGLCPKPPRLGQRSLNRRRRVLQFSASASALVLWPTWTLLAAKVDNSERAVRKSFVHHFTFLPRREGRIVHRYRALTGTRTKIKRSSS
jgi:hypothetical protein